jgi:hypothetical protein
MSHTKRRGYRVERKVRMMFEERGWKTIRAGASLGEADLVCIKKGKCILLQVKSTKGKKLYYYEYMKPKLEGLPFFIVVDFGYGKIRISSPKKTLGPKEGIDLEKFLKRPSKL